MRLPALVLACLITMLSLPLQAQDEAGRERRRHRRRLGLGLRYQHRGRVSPGQGLRPRQNRASQPEHQLLRAVPLHEPDAGRPDLHRPPGPGARRSRRATTSTGTGPSSGSRASSTSRGFATTSRSGRCRRRSRPCCSATSSTSSAEALGLGVGHQPEPHGALDAGLVAVLGVQRPADGGGVLSRRVLVRLLRHRSAAAEVLVHRLGQHQHQPARYDRRQRHARHGVQRERRLEADAPANSARVVGLGDLEYHTTLATQFGVVGRPQPRIPLRLGQRAAQRHPDQALRRRSTRSTPTRWPRA